MGRLRETLSHGKSFVGETINHTKNDVDRLISRTTDLTLDPARRLAYWVALQRDVLADRQASQRFHDVEPLAALGTFAAGIAHELRNPVSTALLATETAAELNRLGQTLAVADALVRAIQSLERCGEVINSIFNMSRDEVGGKFVCDLAALRARRPRCGQRLCG